MLLPTLSLGLAWIAVQAQANKSDPYLEFSQKIEASIRTGDGSWADQSLDPDAFVERMFRSTPADDSEKASWKPKAKETFNLGKRMSKIVRAGGSYSLLRMARADGKTIALFRMTTGDHFTYHEYLLVAGATGLRVADVYIFATAEWLSDSVQRMYLAYIASQPSLLEKLTGEQNQYATGVAKAAAAKDLIQQKKPEDALRLCSQIDGPAKRDKYVFMVRFQAASQIGGKPLEDTLVAFRQAFPNDPALPLLSIAPHLSARRYDAALSSIDELDARIGGDPYLECVRAQVYLESERLDQAAASAIRAIEKDKSLQDGYWLLVTVSLRQSRFADTVRWLSAIEKEFRVGVEDLSEEREFDQFLKSPEYQTWIKSRKKDP